MCTIDDGDLELAPSACSRLVEPVGLGEAAVLGRPGAELVDTMLLQEISLLAEVIASLSGIGSHLTLEQVDAVLGVPPTALPAAARSASPDSAEFTPPERATA